MNSKTDSKKLNQFLRDVKFGDHKKMQKRIIDECRITNDILKNWKYGRSDIPELAKQVLNEIAMQYSKKKIFF